ncbi:hypothetical protein [Agrobacterium sp. OT33]|uniref:hypothetical protein n=1 Tax=Agrobacterium sp. OT33 TaxID=2815338 RepID=UPI001A8C4D8E|nr:hypothetical protein [Agrobacterium sp. OT33]MBO0126701.1 hypothetical protein [Agrobacterium sp. OT33]
MLLILFPPPLQALPGGLWSGRNCWRCSPSARRSLFSRFTDSGGSCANAGENAGFPAISGQVELIVFGNGMFAFREYAYEDGWVKAGFVQE